MAKLVEILKAFLNLIQSIFGKKEETNDQRGEVKKEKPRKNEVVPVKRSKDLNK